MKKKGTNSNQHALKKQAESEETGHSRKNRPDGLEGTLHWCKQGIQESRGHW